MNAAAKRWIRLAGLIVGLALIASAVFVLWDRRAQVNDALDALSNPSPWLLALLPLCVFGNLALTSLMFHQLMRRYGNVRCAEMQALIAASALANYLPLRPGLFGRVAYHAAVNKIPAKHSLMTIVQAIALTGIGAGVLLLILLVANLAPAVPVWLLLCVPPVALLVSMIALRGSNHALWCGAGLARYGDLLLWIARYAIAFALIGAPIDLTGAVAFACVGTLATMIPLSSNGLGLREWAVGLLAAQFAANTLELGITAELVNRAAEILVIAIAGTIGAAWLARRHRS